MSIPVSGFNPAGRWAARYFDGQLPVAKPVQVEITPAGLIIRSETATETWDFSHIRQTHGSFQNEPLRFEKRGTNAALVFPEESEGILEALRATGWSGSRLGRRRLRFTPPVLAAGVVAILAVLAVGYLWVLPAGAAVSARLVPISWEERLGKQVSIQLAPESQDCGTAEARDALDRILGQLRVGDNSAYPYRLRLVRERMVNAFAAPGGQIVVYSGLLEKTDSPEELAGVLAHEIEHVELRHSTTAILRSIGLQVLFTSAFGGGGGQIASAAETLGSLKYQRSDEEAADREGMKRLERLHVDPRGMIHFFEKLRKTEVNIPGFLSTHPLTADRIAALRQLAGSATYAPEPIGPVRSWSTISHACAGK